MNSEIKQLIQYHDVHEVKIVEHFGQKGVKLDSPVVSKKDIAPLFLCFTNRSGSNALGEDIGFLDGCHFLGEVLNFDNVINRSIKNKYDNFTEYLNGILINKNCQTPIIKASFSQLVFLYSNGYFQYYFKNSKFIHIERRDLLEQAISLFIASHTKKWASFQKAVDQPPKLVIKDVVKIMDSLSNQNSQFKTFFSLTRAVYMNVNYEQYTAHRLKVLNRIIKFLGINSLPDKLPSKKFTKQISVEKNNYKKLVIQHFKL